MIQLYGHPFAAFAWKAFIAAYERDVPFELCMLSPEHPETAARLVQLSPTGQIPALVDGEVEVTGSNAVIYYLDGIGDAPPLIPVDRLEDVRARMFADIFDDYVLVSMQRFVIDVVRAEGEKDPRGVADARATLDRVYAWLETRITDEWAIGSRFTIADCAAAPALFYADWVHDIPGERLRAYRARLLARPSVARVVEEARPYRPLFPFGAPDRD